MSQLKNVKVLTTCALLLALATILGFFKIPITQLIEIRFSSLPIAFGGAMFGPAIGALIGALADILQYLVKPTGPYFPGFTISSLVGGIIFGFTLRIRNGRITIFKCMVAQLLYTIIVGLLINTLNLYILYGDPTTQGVAGYFAYMATRLPKEAIMYPINTGILYAITRVIPWGRIDFIRK